MASNKIFREKSRQPIMILILGLLFLMIFIFIAACYYANFLNRAKSLKQAKIIINTKVISAELVSSPRDLYLGLSKRDYICEDCGMLFIFPDKQLREFVMRDMKFSLDIVFISGDKIIKIAENLAPDYKSPLTIYQSDFPVDKVLELSGNYCQKNKINIGDTIIIK